MSEDDPRHGTYAGAVAHWLSGGRPCDDCARAETRYRKRRKLRILHGDRATVPALGVLRRIQALHALGYTGPQIADAAGVSVNAMRSIDYHEAVSVRAGTEQKIAAAYERLCMVRPEGRYANRARSMAAQRGWAPPLAWDDIDNDEAPAAEAVRCSMEGCENPARCRGWCDNHYRRWLRSGTPDGVGKGRPRGDSASYNAVHLRLKRDRGIATQHLCCDCGQPARTWSYNHSDPGVQVDEKGRPYSTDLAHYTPRCVTCHNKLDRTRPGSKAAHRRAQLEDMDALGASISAVCKALSMRRSNLEKWCARHDMTPLYSRLVDRESIRYWSNGVAEGGVA